MSIQVAGPGYSMIAYCLIGTMVFCFMSSLGEMATYLPITGSINAYGTRFFDPALGFMLGMYPCRCAYVFVIAVHLEKEEL